MLQVLSRLFQSDIMQPLDGVGFARAVRRGVQLHAESLRRRFHIRPNRLARSVSFFVQSMWKNEIFPHILC